MAKLCVLLAAGSSQRFGDQNKLNAKINAKTLLESGINLINSSKFEHKIIVIDSCFIIDDYLKFLDGWTILTNPQSSLGLNSSKNLAIDFVKNNYLKGEVTFLLADMPLIRIQDLSKILKITGIVFSRISTTVGPPLKVPYEHLIKDLSSKKLASNPHTIIEFFDRSLDVDTPEDLNYIININDLTSSS